MGVGIIQIVWFDCWSVDGVPWFGDSGFPEFWRCCVFSEFVDVLWIGGDLVGLWIWLWAFGCVLVVGLMWDCLLAAAMGGVI